MILDGIILAAAMITFAAVMVGIVALITGGRL